MERFVNDLGRELTEKEIELFQLCLNEAEDNFGDIFRNNTKLSEVINGFFRLGGEDYSFYQGLETEITRTDLVNTQKILDIYEERIRKYKEQISILKEELTTARLEIDFAPGGVGMLKAEKEFEKMVGKKRIKKRRNSL